MIQSSGHQSSSSTVRAQPCLLYSSVQERAASQESKPWLFAINAFNSRVEAAIKIQRAWRSFRARCIHEQEWPSDLNPHHW